MKKYFILISVILLILSNVWAQTNTENLDLTDEERNQLQNYSSESYNQQAMEDLCGLNDEDDDKKKEGFKWKSDLKDACQGRALKTWGIDEDTIAVLSKAYSQFSVMMSMGGGGNLVKNATTEGAETATKTVKKTTEGAADAAKKGKPKANKKSKIDYCGMIGAGAEIASGYQQQQYQKYLSGLPENADNLQTESMIKMKNNYREKSKNLELNSLGWSSTSVCYTGQMLSGNFSGGTLIKTAAATVLGIYNASASKNHNSMANELNVIIQKMPQNGDCNPITETHCFCNLPENLNNEKYCLPQIRARAYRKYGTQVSCLDKYGRPDGDCSCRGQNNCFDVTYMNTLDGISFGESYEEASKKAMAKTSKGIYGKSSDLGSGSLSTSAVNKMKNQLRKISNIRPDNTRPLTSSQKKQAQFIHKLGLPKNLSSALARAPRASAKTLAMVRNRFNRRNRNFNFRKKKSKKSRVQSFTGGSDFSLGKKNSRRRSSRFDIKSMMKKKRGSASSRGGKVLNFAEKARAKASISKRTDISIFKIISRRYQLSSEQRLK